MPPLAALAVVASAVLASCAGGGGDGSARPAGDPDASVRAARLAAAPGATVASGTARTASRATLSGLVGRPDPIVLLGTGVVDFAAGRAASILDLSGLLPDHELPAAARHLETRFVDGSVFVRSPVLTSLVGVTTPWMRIQPASGPMAGTGSDLARLTQVAGSDGSALLALLTGVVPGSVQDHGQEQVRGETATHMGATVDFRTAVEKAGALTDSDRFEQLVAGLGAEQLHVDAFLDEKGRLLRLGYEHQLPGPGGGTQRLELELYDFGSPAVVEVPPADEVTDLELDR